jgi:hypothetical protein
MDDQVYCISSTTDENAFDIVDRDIDALRELEGKAIELEHQARKHQTELMALTTSLMILKSQCLHVSDSEYLSSSMHLIE